ncbi:cmgc/cdk/pitslre protein kinase [Xylariomycetidae sp. FL0641]|nr:cmgc/cdk/pitslre protein kinase [Xylariomycetidae sp. FL0641]
MASKSRWADTEEDAALEAKLKREKEEKKRLKAEKARKAEEARQAQEKAEAARQQAQQQEQADADRPPAKRRKLSPEPNDDRDTNESGTRKLLRFTGGGFGPARSVENYDKLNDIEEGAYGWVSRARNLATGRVVALKKLKLDEQQNARAGLSETALREMQILRDCRRGRRSGSAEGEDDEEEDDDEARNIVALREVVVGEDPARPAVYLVLDFLEHDLKSVLEDMPEPFLASEVKTLLRQLASGVAFLHDRYVLHRDLKTSNLLLSNRGVLKIADFGMARYVGDPPPPNGLTQLVVTLWYRAPELLLGARTYGRAVDMWSVGCIFGELLTREPLLQGRNEVDELTQIFALCGVPTDDAWPGFRRLPNARSLRLPARNPAAATGSVIRARFPLLTAAGAALLSGLLALNPDARPSAKDMLQHEYFRQDPKPKHEALFPTFPSRAGQERRRRRDTPNAPGRGQAAADLGAVDFSGIFAGREKEERGGGFALRMV